MGNRWNNSDTITRLLDKTIYDGDCLIYMGSPSKVKDWEAPMVLGPDGEYHSVAKTAYMILVGVISKGMSILHTCDRGRCWRPRHLYQGTTRQNIRDRVSRNRTGNVYGEHHPNSKLTIEKVRDIKRRIRNGGDSTSIAILFNINRSTVDQIKRGQTWRGV